MDPEASARAAGLRYVSDHGRGIRRARAGRGFTYVDARGHRLTDRETLARIRSLAIPPAWTDVWICPSSRGHVQATGRDARGRKQYRYHPRWVSTRDETKYGRMVVFGEHLPEIRKVLARDLSSPGLSREKVLATVVRILDTGYIRVGNDSYQRENRSYGLTTLRDQHVKISGSTLLFRFRGKSGVENVVEVQDRRIAGIVKRCRDIPGYRLFQYLDEDGKRRSIDSQDVNRYLRKIGGQSFTAKDFRTWAGSVLAAAELAQIGAFDSETEGNRNVVAAVKEVAARLGNTVAVCRKCYVHPHVMEAYLDGSLPALAEKAAAEEPPPELDRDEALLLLVLRDRQAAAAAA